MLYWSVLKRRVQSEPHNLVSSCVVIAMSEKDVPVSTVPYIVIRFLVKDDVKSAGIISNLSKITRAVRG